MRRTRQLNCRANPQNPLPPTHIFPTILLEALVTEAFSSTFARQMGVRLLDTFHLGKPGIIGAVLVETQNGLLLFDTATRIYGDQMERLWGRFGPVAEQRIRIMNDGDVVRIPPFEVRAIATPGHANHHNAYQWEDNLFGGDITGVQMGGGPPVPP